MKRPIFTAILPRFDICPPSFKISKGSAWSCSCAPRISVIFSVRNMSSSNTIRKSEIFLFKPILHAVVMTKINSKVAAAHSFKRLVKFFFRLQIVCGHPSRIEGIKKLIFDVKFFHLRFDYSRRSVDTAGLITMMSKCFATELPLSVGSSVVSRSHGAFQVGCVRAFSEASNPTS